MLSRIIVALISIPFLIYVVLKGEIIFWVLMTGIGVMATYEFYRMLENKKVKAYKYFGIGISFLIPSAYYFRDSLMWVMEKGPYFFVALLFIILIIIQIFLGKIEEASMKLAYTVLGILYIPFLFSHVFALKDLENGRYWILTALLLVWACDSAAYFIGIKFGKHKMAPSISPKKSIEGGLAGITAPIISMFIIKYALYFKNVEISILHIIVVGAIVGIVGQVGDLAESMFKREYGIKDSGNLLLGHGGFLDRFDSLIFIIPILFYYLKLFVV
jgi:phosphatidate cytidylyltransferase